MRACSTLRSHVQTLATRYSSILEKDLFTDRELRNERLFYVKQIRFRVLTKTTR